MTKTVSVLTDQPTANDGFGAWKYASAIAQLLRGTASTPLTIGVHGEWGSGKTSLLRMIQAAIQPTTAFASAPSGTGSNGSLQLSQQNIACLLPYASSVEHATTRHSEFIRAYEAWRATQFTPERTALKAEYEANRAAVASMYLKPGQPVFDVIWFNAWQFDNEALVWQALLESIREHLVASPLYPIDSRLAERIGKALRSGIVRGLRIATAAVTAGAVGESGIESYLEEAKTRLAIRAELTRVIAEAIAVGGTVGHPLKLAIMIDDLDRCSPATVIGLLERLKIFFDVEGCVFFLAAAESVIEAGIEAKGVELGYGGYFAGKGRQYLEKIIQLPLRLPQLQVSQVCSLIHGLGLDEQLTSVTLGYAPYLTPNPRQIKRLANVLAFLSAYVKANESDVGVKIDMTVIAHNVVVQFEWPELYRGFIRYGFKFYDMLQQLARGEWSAVSAFAGKEIAAFPPDEWSRMDAQARRAVVLRTGGRARSNRDDPARELAWECYCNQSLWTFLVNMPPLSTEQFSAALSLAPTVLVEPDTRPPRSPEHSAEQSNFEGQKEDQLP